MNTLTSKRILVVEDRFLLGDDLRRNLSLEGAEVIGPAASVEAARGLVARERIDLAVLDIDLRGDTVFELASELEEKGIPFLFASGLPLTSLPERWRNTPFVTKPASVRRIVQTIGQLLETAGDR